MLVQDPSVDQSIEEGVSQLSSKAFEDFSDLYKTIDIPNIACEELALIFEEHGYSKHWSEDQAVLTGTGLHHPPTSKLFDLCSLLGQKPWKTLSDYYDNVEDDLVDVETVPPNEAPSISYDKERALKLMRECERHVEFVSTQRSSRTEQTELSETEDADEKEFAEMFDPLTREEWSLTQKRVYDKALHILDNERLSRLSLDGVQHEPFKRRALLDRWAAKFRKLLGAHCRCDPELSLWLHNTLVANLTKPYLAAYLDIMQTLRYYIPSIIDKIILQNTGASKQTTAVKTGGNVISQQGLNLLLKRPWDPALSTLHHHKPVKLPPQRRPVLVVVPGNLLLSASSIKRHEVFLTQLQRLTTVTAPQAPALQHDTPLEGFLEACVSIVLSKLSEYTNKGRPVVLLGWGPAALLACQISALESSVAGVVCMSLPFSSHTDVLANCTGSNQSMGKGRGGSEASGEFVTTAEILQDVSCPLLFIQGEKDLKCCLPELERVRKVLPERSQLLVVTGAGGDLRISSLHRYQSLLTNSIVDRCLVDEVGKFLSSLMPVHPEPDQHPPDTIITSQSASSTLQSSTAPAVLSSAAATPSEGIAVTRRKTIAGTSPESSRPPTPVLILPSDTRIGVPMQSGSAIAWEDPSKHSLVGVLKAASGAVHLGDGSPALTLLPAEGGYPPWHQPTPTTGGTPTTPGRGTRRGRRPGRGRGRAGRALPPERLIALGGGVGVAAQAHLSAGRRSAQNLSTARSSKLGRQPVDPDMPQEIPRTKPGRNFQSQQKVTAATLKEQSQAQLLAAVASITPQSPPASPKQQTVSYVAPQQATPQQQSLSISGAQSAQRQVSRLLTPVSRTLQQPQSYILTDAPPCGEPIPEGAFVVSFENNSVGVDLGNGTIISAPLPASVAASVAVSSVPTSHYSSRLVTTPNTAGRNIIFPTSSNSAVAVSSPARVLAPGASATSSVASPLLQQSQQRFIISGGSGSGAASVLSTSSNASVPGVLAPSKHTSVAPRGTSQGLRFVTSNPLTSAAATKITPIRGLLGPRTGFILPKGSRTPGQVVGVTSGLRGQTAVGGRQFVTFSGGSRIRVPGPGGVVAVNTSTLSSIVPSGPDLTNPSSPLTMDASTCTSPCPTTSSLSSQDCSSMSEGQQLSVQHGGVVLQVKNTPNILKMPTANVAQIQRAKLRTLDGRTFVGRNMPQIGTVVAASNVVKNFAATTTTTSSDAFETTSLSRSGIVQAYSGQVKIAGTEVSTGTAFMSDTNSSSESLPGGKSKISFVDTRTTGLSRQSVPVSKLSDVVDVLLETPDVSGVTLISPVAITSKDLPRASSSTVASTSSAVEIVKEYDSSKPKLTTKNILLQGPKEKYFIKGTIPSKVPVSQMKILTALTSEGNSGSSVIVAGRPTILRASHLTKQGLLPTVPTGTTGNAVFTSPKVVMSIASSSIIKPSATAQVVSQRIEGSNSRAVCTEASDSQSAVRKPPAIASVGLSDVLSEGRYLKQSTNAKASTGEDFYEVDVVQPNKLVESSSVKATTTLNGNTPSKGPAVVTTSSNVHVISTSQAMHSLGSKCPEEADAENTMDKSVAGAKVTSNVKMVKVSNQSVAHIISPSSPRPATIVTSSASNIAGILKTLGKVDKVTLPPGVKFKLLPRQETTKISLRDAVNLTTSPKVVTSLQSRTATQAKSSQAEETKAQSCAKVSETLEKLHEHVKLVPITKVASVPSPLQTQKVGVKDIEFSVSKKVVSTVADSSSSEKSNTAAPVKDPDMQPINSERVKRAQSPNKQVIPSRVLKRSYSLLEESDSTFERKTKLESPQQQTETKALLDEESIEVDLTISDDACEKQAQPSSLENKEDVLCVLPRALNSQSESTSDDRHDKPEKCTLSSPTCHLKVSYSDKISPTRSSLPNTVTSKGVSPEKVAKSIFSPSTSDTDSPSKRSKSNIVGSDSEGTNVVAEGRSSAKHETTNVIRTKKRISARLSVAPYEQNAVLRSGKKRSTL